MTTEHEHVLLAIQGDKRSLAWLFEEYRARVFRFHYHKVGELQTAEDLTSETFLRMLSFIHSYVPGPAPFFGWLSTIARNALIDYSRRQHGIVFLDDLNPQCYGTILYPLADEIEDDLSDWPFLDQRAVMAAVGKLSPLHQRIVHLKYEMDWNMCEIAQALDLPSEGAAKAQVHRIRVRLRSYLEGSTLDL